QPTPPLAAVQPTPPPERHEIRRPLLPAILTPGSDEWMRAQIAMIICGLLAALLALIVAPRASTMTIAAIDSEPARCLVLGIFGLGALALINVINAELNATVI